MASISRIYTFVNDKTSSPVKLEIELGNIINTWNNHEQGLQTHNFSSINQLRLIPTVVTAAGTYVIVTADVVVVLNKTVGAATTVTLPASPNTGRILIIKDGKGDAAANNITISGNGKNLDGSANLTISSNFGVSRIVYNGTQWNAI